MKIQKILLGLLVTIALAFSIVMVVPVIAAPPTFTGDVETDFPAGPSILIFTDPSSDVGLPAGVPGGTVSGWDVKDLRLTYNSTTDTMYVGINTVGILGDADGDGNPGGTSAWLAVAGGQDVASLNQSEAACVYFDLDQDGTYDVIAGISGATDYSGFSVNNFTGVFYPPINFGAALPGNMGTISPDPSAGAPDLEFTITNWSTLPGHDVSVGFDVGAFLGSLQDNGIGEDFLSGVYSPAINIVKKTNGTDNNSPTGPAVQVGATVNWTYEVTNPGNVPLSNIVVTDDNSTPGTPGDDWSPTYVSGDDGDGILQTTETWLFQASGIATVGQYANTGTATGDSHCFTVSDSDPDHYIGVDARISIMPFGTNQLNTAHNFTVHVEENDGTGWSDAVGVTVSPTHSGVGSITSTGPYITDVNGEVIVTVNSAVAGTATVHASGTVTVRGVHIAVATDGYGAYIVEDEKTWVDARISITPFGTNQLNTAHNFTVHVEENDGTGWSDAVGVNVTPTHSGVGGITSTGPYITDVNGQVTITVNSANVGTATVHASASVLVDSGSIDVDTDGYGAYIVENDKTWVDARISITPSDTNPVNTPHDFTVHVEENDGTGWSDAVGVNVTPTHSGVGSITSTGPYITDVNGQVTVTVNSATEGTATVHASGMVIVSGIPISVATNGYGAYEVDNIKTWTNGNGGSLCVGCPCDYKECTVDWDGLNTTRTLYANDRLAADLLGPSPDGMHSLLLERSTHAPVVGRITHYLIVVRELEQEETPPLPENTIAIVAFNVTPDDAEFDRDIFLTLGLDQVQLPENAVNATLAYYDDINEVWVPMESEAGGPPNTVAELSLSAAINHFTIYAVLVEVTPSPPPPPAAHFAASGLDIVTSVETGTFVTRTGESVTITANVANDGEQEGTYTVELTLDGETVDTEIVTLGAGKSQQVSFTLSGLDYGQHEVEVAGLPGEFTTSRTITWWLIIIIILAIGLIIWGVVRVRRQRRAAQEG